MSTCTRARGSRLAAMLVVATLGGCRPPPETTTPPEPEPASEPEIPAEQNTYVSTSHNDERDPDDGAAEDVRPSGLDGEFAITTPEAAKEAAQAAVEADLDPNKSWTLSPVLPSAWPAKEPAVVVFFYPMVTNPPSLTEYQLFTPAFRVKVSLEDASTEIKPVGKRRKLGTIQQTRATSLERRELEMAEMTLVGQLLGQELNKGSRPYWGYLKYIHEHPKLGRDLERRAAKFIGWVRRKNGR